MNAPTLGLPDQSDSLLIALVAFSAPGQGQIVRTQGLGNDVRKALPTRGLSPAIGTGRHALPRLRKIENRNSEDSPRGTECAAGIPPHALAHCHSTQNENQRGCLRV
jgi:hypothetical protein